MEEGAGLWVLKVSVLLEFGCKSHYPPILLIYLIFTAYVILVSELQEITVGFLGNILFHYRE